MLFSPLNFYFCANSFNLAKLYLEIYVVCSWSFCFYMVYLDICSALVGFY